MEVFSLLPDALIVSADSILQLLAQLADALFLEDQLLALERLLSFELNLALSQLIQSLLVLGPHQLDLLSQIALLAVQFSPHLADGLVLLGDLRGEGLLLVFEGGDHSLLPGELGSQLLDLGDQLSSLLVELV